MPWSPWKMKKKLHGFHIPTIYFLMSYAGTFRWAQTSYSTEEWETHSLTNFGHLVCYLLNHNLLLLTFFCGGFSGSLVTVLPLLFKHLCTHQLCWICHMGNVQFILPLYYHHNIIYLLIIYISINIFSSPFFTIFTGAELD